MIKDLDKISDDELINSRAVDVANKYYISTYTVYRLIKRRKLIPKRKYAEQHLSRFDWDRLNKLTVREQAKETGYSVRTVSNYKKKFGITKTKNKKNIKK